jgi:outer membrane receptor protein involved in Fe transport
MITVPRALAHSVSTIAVMAGLAASSAAIAQTGTAPTGQVDQSIAVQPTGQSTAAPSGTPGDSTAGTTEDIVVTGIRASLNRAIDIKRNSAGVVDAISAEDIGKFPDTNLAESLQRITGVSITRANGEGSQVAVRGFSGGFNLVTLNGRQLASTRLPEPRIRRRRHAGGLQDRPSEHPVGRHRRGDQRRDPPPARRARGRPVGLDRRQGTV